MDPELYREHEGLVKSSATLNCNLSDRNGSIEREAAIQGPNHGRSPANVEEPATAMVAGSHRKKNRSSEATGGVALRPVAAAGRVARR